MRYLSAALGACVVGVFVCAPANAAFIGIPDEITTGSFAVGETIEVPLVVYGLANTSATTLGAFDLVIQFSSLLLDFQSVAFGDPNDGDQLNFSGLDLPGLGFAGYSDMGSTLRLFEISLDPINTLVAQQSDAFVLATLSFEALAAGRSVLDIREQVSAVGDADGNALEPIFYIDGDISIVEPATLLLVVLALLLLLTNAAISRARTTRTAHRARAAGRTAS